ncbi:MAG: hypothetical protein H7252_06475 [Cytophaga sp.]|nr:hypothetical protein [Undibacterium sp.]
MTSPIQYLKNQTQIDLSNPDINNYINSIADIQSPKPSSIPIKIDLRAVYDSVIGIDRSRNCGFDKSGVAPERLRKTDLDKLSKIATNIREKQILYDKINRVEEISRVILPKMKAAVKNQNSDYSDEEFFSQLKIECEKFDIDSRIADVSVRLKKTRPLLQMKIWKR